MSQENVEIVRAGSDIAQSIGDERAPTCRSRSGGPDFECALDPSRCDVGARAVYRGHDEVAGVLAQDLSRSFDGHPLWSRSSSWTSVTRSWSSRDSSRLGRGSGGPDRACDEPDVLWFRDGKIVRLQRRSATTTRGPRSRRAVGSRRCRNRMSRWSANRCASASGSGRTLDERLLMRFPRLADAFARLLSTLPPRLAVPSGGRWDVP